MGNDMKELPKTFYNAKREFEKSFNFAISKAKNENKDKEIEKLNVDMETKDNKLAKFRAKNAELGQKAVKFQQELEKLNGMGVQPKAPTIPKNVVFHDTLYKSNGEKKKVVIVKKKSTT